jgi:hypothetical protein
MTVLKENPEKAIRRFMREGLLQHASLSGLLGYQFTVPELKLMLRKKGLAVSGRKADLIQRLVHADPEGMREAARVPSALQCTGKGRVIAEEYLAREKESRAMVEQQTLQALRERRFEQAAQLVAAFEVQQVFPRGVGIDWENYDPTADIAMLGFIFGSRPKILGQLDRCILDHLRLAAGMMHLWGTSKARGWLPPRLVTGLVMNNNSASRMLCFHASYQVDMEQYRRSPFIKYAEISTANDNHVCAACLKIAGKKYSLSKVPELPYEHCTSEVGCRCQAVPVTEI